MNKLKRRWQVLVLFVQALEEILRLRKYATQEEKRRLDLYSDALCGYNRSMCVYGCMTTDCYSNRALVLIKLAAKHFYFSDIKRIFEPKVGPGEYCRDFTALEILLWHFPNTTKRLVKLFLKPHPINIKQFVLLVIMASPAIAVLVYALLTH